MIDGKHKYLSTVHQHGMDFTSLNPVFSCDLPLKLDFQLLSRGEVVLCGGGGRTGPDWAALVKNEVAVILDYKNDVLLGSSIGVPDSFVIVGAAHSSVSHKGLLY
jgi:hypothetical protein